MRPVAIDAVSELWRVRSTCSRCALHVARSGCAQGAWTQSPNPTQVATPPSRPEHTRAYGLTGLVVRGRFSGLPGTTIGMIPSDLALLRHDPSVERS
jgi:hypothetical protein